MATLAKLLRSKPIVWALILLPGFWPLWPLLVSANPTVLADPLKYILHHLGLVACLLLVAVLTFTPLRMLFPKSPIVQALNRHRRLVGVSAAAYAAVHFATHVVYEGGTDPSAVPFILQTAVAKPFQLIGLIALSILIVLAATSPHAMVRWLGGRRWKTLHRLAYVAAALVAFHQATARKVFPMQVVWIFAPLVLLEVLRVARQRSRGTPGRGGPTGGDNAPATPAATPADAAPPASPQSNFTAATEHRRGHGALATPRPLACEASKLHAFASACSRSAFKSAKSSMPTDNRT